MVPLPVGSCVIDRLAIGWFCTRDVHENSKNGLAAGNFMPLGDLYEALLSQTIMPSVILEMYVQGLFLVNSTPKF